MYVHYIGKLNDIIILDALGFGILYYKFGYNLGAGLAEGIAYECSKTSGKNDFNLMTVNLNNIKCPLIKKSSSSCLRYNRLVCRNETSPP